MKDLRDRAVSLLKRSSGIGMELDAENVEALEDNISMFVWMYRNGLERNRIADILSFLLDAASSKAAKAVIELSKTDTETDGDAREIFSRVTNG